MSLNTGRANSAGDFHGQICIKSMQKGCKKTAISRVACSGCANNINFKCRLPQFEIAPASHIESQAFKTSESRLRVACTQIEAEITHLESHNGRSHVKQTLR